MHLTIPLCISRSSVVPSRRVGYFLEFSVNFSLFVGQILIWSLFISLLSMNTSSYNPIASGTYNRWKVEFVLKTKMTKNINTTQAMAELYTSRLGGSHFHTFLLTSWINNGRFLKLLSKKTRKNSCQEDITLGKSRKRELFKCSL